MVSRVTDDAPRRSRAHPLHIRPATLVDAPAITAAMRASVRGLARGAVPDHVLAAWAALPPLYHRWAMTVGGERYLVACRAERVVGYAAVHGAELTALFVRPREARRGTGSALLARAERLVAGAAMIVKAAPSGLAFYRARGFRGRRPVRVPLPGGAALEAIRMTKPLATAARRGGGTGTGGSGRAPRAGGTHRSPRRSARGRRARTS